MTGGTTASLSGSSPAKPLGKATSAKEKKPGSATPRSGSRTPRGAPATPRSVRSSTPTRSTDDENGPYQGNLPSYMRQTTASLTKRRTADGHSHSISSAPALSHEKRSSSIGPGIIPKGYDGRMSPVPLPRATSATTGRATSEKASSPTAGARKGGGEGAAAKSASKQVAKVDGTPADKPNKSASPKENPTAVQANAGSAVKKVSTTSGRKSPASVRSPPKMQKTASMPSKTGSKAAADVTANAASKGGKNPTSTKADGKITAKSAPSSPETPDLNKEGNDNSSVTKTVKRRLFGCIVPGRKSVAYD